MILWLLGCFTVVNDELGNRYPERPFHDFDEDGLVDDQDCDDANAEIGAPQTYYLDADGDGFPDESTSDIFCPDEKPSGYLLPRELNGVVVFDCNDQDVGLNPEDFDQDGISSCDGDCDDRNSAIVDPQTYYQDADGDGFPNEAVSEEVCPAEKSDGYISARERNGAVVFDCNDQDVDVNPEDFDQDGTSSCDGDCDDRNSGIRNPETYYQDADGDGFGLESDSVTVCPAEKPSGYLLPRELNGVAIFDCNDQDADVNPEDFDQDGTSSCDEDCDDRNSAIVDPQTYYQDADGDGFPNEAISERVCPDEKSDGYISAREQNGVAIFDCDDQDADLSPEDYDQDGTSSCDGDCDNRNSEVLNPENFYRDADGDGFGLESDSVLVCPADKPSGYIEEKLRNGQPLFDCDDSDPNANPDQLEVCDEIDNNCDGAIDELDGLRVNRWYPDADSDGFGWYEDEELVRYSCLTLSGYSQNFLDCDDQNAAIFPNADEVCDGVDNNCNGAADEATALDAIQWYRDQDEDGFGSQTNNIIACEAPVGFILDNSDCNDGDATVFPNATESCNNADDDCDGLVDEGADETAPTGALTFYADTDGDGFGNPDQTRLQCAQPTGFVSDSTDCDDSAATVYPDAPEYCNEIDDDCDEEIDEDHALDKEPYYADGDGDSFGDGGDVVYACPLNQPADTAAVAGDCADGNADIHPDATEVCDEIDNNCDGLIDDQDANLDQNTAQTFYADTDADGFGNPLESTLRCLQPPGFVQNADDCDDSSLLRNPNGTEYCNNLDDDCDDEIDNLAIDSSDYYLDGDGDGHGHLVDTISGFDLNSCPSYDPITNQPINPSGYAPSNDDCNDDDPTISPSADELCSNDVDENCDGHNTAGATNVSTFLVDSDEDGFGSGVRDESGSLAYALDLCVQPFGYIPYAEGDRLDCNDNDVEVFPLDPNSQTYADDLLAQELCNGKVDRCDNDVYGDMRPPDNEWDDDGDGRVECTLDVDPLQWADQSLGIVGGDDCDDNDAFSYPDAPELCNGAFEDCNDPLYIALSQSAPEDGLQTAPDDELDDDGDCFVECSGFDASIWEGGAHSCAHVDENGELVQETVVIGGEDCNDDNADTYVGAAYLEPDVCAQDANGDGAADCNLIGIAGVNSNYFCDFGVFPSNGGVGPDFVLIPAGDDPLGNYSLTSDFYVMTTEVTQAMWSAVMGDGSSVSHFPKGSVNWYDAIAFANALSVMTSREKCYANTDDPNIDFDQNYDPDALDSSFSSPHDCSGFRLLTEAEWEYATRSGTQYDFWTPAGGGNYSANACNGTETIQDGTDPEPLLRDYAWYCGNNSNQYGANGSKEVGQKLPNGFGLYDMHGNLREWTADWYGCSFPPTSTDPYCDSVGSSRVFRGGYWSDGPSSMRASARGDYGPTYRNGSVGFRLGLHP